MAAVAIVWRALEPLGMPYPQNLETALAVEAIVRSHGCVPATVAAIDGELRVGRGAVRVRLLPDSPRGSSRRCGPHAGLTLHGAGLSTDALATFAKAGSAALKTSRRDLGSVLARRQLGATTVAGTMAVAHMAGIPVFVTGGIGTVIASSTGPCLRPTHRHAHLLRRPWPA